MNTPSLSRRGFLRGATGRPDGSRLSSSSQRGTNGLGVTFEVSGPFRTEREQEPARGRRPAPRGRP